MRYFFSSDEHYGHKNIIKYCNRPFKDVLEMDYIIIQNHNEVVKEEDTVIHAGDFALIGKERVQAYIGLLKGNHVFLQGSHDRWLSTGRFLWEKTIDDDQIVVCHYPMLSWPRSFHGSWLLHGHSHGNLTSYPGIYDIGVDNNDFKPVSWQQIKTKIWR